MQNVKRKLLRASLVLSTLLLISFAGLLWARPGAVACAFIDQSSLVNWSDANYSESTHTQDHDRYDFLLRRARSRINRVFGESRSNPHIIFFDSTKPILFYKPNAYGSTQFVGKKTCVFIGPKGQNVDVVAHELVHADIYAALGTIDRTLHMPVWLDEGLAMQVDFRPQYQLNSPSNEVLQQVGAWNSYEEFFNAPEPGALANRYALSKARVQKWVDSIGPNNVFTELKSLVSGGMSEEARNAGL